MKEEWTNHGLDKVELIKYDILLSFPKKNVLPLARIINSSSGAEVFRARQKEKTVEAKEDNDKVLPPFNAYSASGNVTGRLVFVNYGRIEDFQKLNKSGINVTGRIVIAKYGEIFRGNKEKYAQEHGAIGLILYSDPKDYSPGVSPNDTYPKTWWLPSSGVQRGSIFMKSGDPLTIGYPSIEGMYRTPKEDAGLPKLPVYPISASDAKHFLNLLKNEKAPDDWQGGLDMDYYLTMPDSTNLEVNLNVQMDLKTMPVYNVMGVLRGSVEPDRLVLFGNHRDAWAFGAVDPSSGTATLMETVRVIGRLKKQQSTLHEPSLGPITRRVYF
ncbi:N-acetylated-alpha-linked acidic dipeptidase 2 [Exaiptasia diaphana]|nr:N-acetylated-alpha-linked acidic dipeptidase 2 [Exaiptasia diaphana]